MANWTPRWIVTTTTTCGETFSELFDTLAGARIYAASVKAGLPGSKTTIVRV